LSEFFSNWDSAEIAGELAALEVWQREALAAVLRADGCLDLGRVSPEAREALIKLASALSFLDSGDDPAEQGRVLRIIDGAWPALCAALEGTERRRRKASEEPIQIGLSPPPSSSKALEDLVQHGGLCRWGVFDKAQRQQLSEAAQSPWGRGRLSFFETRRGLVLALSPQAYLELDARPRAESWLPARPDWALSAISVLGLAERGELKLHRSGAFTKTQRALLGLDLLTSSEPHAWELIEAEAFLLDTLLRLGWIDSSGTATENAPPRQASALELLRGLRRGLLLALELRDEPSAEKALLGLCGGRAQSLTCALDRVLLTELWENSSNSDDEFEDRRLRSWVQVAPIAVALGLAELGLDALGAPVSLKPRPRLPQQPPQILAKRRHGRKILWDLECAEPLELLPFARFGFFQRTGNRASLELSAPHRIAARDLSGGDERSSQCRKSRAQLKAPGALA
jgi:hypothetical protein